MAEDKKYYGIRKQIEDSKDEPYEVLTEDKLRGFIKDTFANTTQEEELVTYSSCIEKGIVRRTNKSMNLCANDNCEGCNQFRKL